MSITSGSGIQGANVRGITSSATGTPAGAATPVALHGFMMRAVGTNDGGQITIRDGGAGGTVKFTIPAAFLGTTSIDLMFPFPILFATDMHVTHFVDAVGPPVRIAQPVELLVET